MANGIINLTTKGERSTLLGRIVWESVAESETNTSNVTASVQVKKTVTGPTYGHWRGSVQVAGKVQSIYFYASVGASWVEVASLRVDVAHSSNGYGDCYIYATVTGPVETSLENTFADGAQTVTLDTIQRASAVSATSANIGETSAVFMSGNSGYTNSVKWSFGELSGWLDGTGGSSDSEVKLTATSVPFILPDSMYTQIPNEKSGTVTLTCYTYFGDTLIGTSTTQFTATAAESACAPIVALTAKDTRPETIALTGDENRLVINASTASLTLSASAQHGAALTRRRVYVGKYVDLPAGVDTMTAEMVNATRIAAYVDDSRGYRSYAEINPDVVYYIAPIFTASAAWLDIAAGAARITVTGAFFAGSFGAVDNDLQVSCKIGDTTVTAAVTVSSDRFSATANFTGLDYKSDYDVTVTVTDALTSSASEIKLNNAEPIYLMNRRLMRYRVPLEAPSINDSAVGALANAGEFGTLEDADTFIASALSDMDMPSVRRWACIYDFDAAYLTIFASPNGNAEPDCIVKLDLGLKYAIKRGYSEGYLTDIIWEPWTWCDLTTNAPDEYASGIWHVRSWNNGAVELWGTVVENLTFTSWGNIYAAQNAFAAQAYPVTFAEAPVVTATLLPGKESSIYGYGLITGQTAGTVSSTPSFGVIRATAQSAAQSVRLSLYVKGTLAT